MEPTAWPCSGGGENPSKPRSLCDVSDRIPYLNARLQGFGVTIFAEMSALALKTNSVNLGQGFPDTDGPEVVAEAAIAAIRAGHNQYPPVVGIPELRTAVARHQKRFYDIDLDPDAEVQITAGATEAIAATMLSLLEIGDEVVTFEPWYDSYGASIAMAGGVKRVVTLRPPEYAYDGEAFERVITPKTRLVLLNTPHNPTGKVFTRTELEHIAEVCVRHDLIVVTDEVYEHLVFDGEHIPLATLPGMRERTLTISSVGKTFSFTGWKTGWVSGPESLVTAVRTAKQFLTFVSSAAWQHGAAVALDLDDDYYRDFTADMAVKRAVLCAGLTASGLTVHEPQGTYFVNTDIRSLSGEDGADFCLALPERVGVVGVPTQVFYDNVHEGRHLVRFTFCKRIEVLEEASMRLAGLRQTMEADR